MQFVATRACVTSYLEGFRESSTCLVCGVVSIGRSSAPEGHLLVPVIRPDRALWRRHDRFLCLPTRQEPAECCRGTGRVPKKRSCSQTTRRNTVTLPMRGGPPHMVRWTSIAGVLAADAAVGHHASAFTPGAASPRALLLLAVHDGLAHRGETGRCSGHAAAQGRWRHSLGCRPKIFRSSERCNRGQTEWRTSA